MFPERGKRRDKRGSQLFTRTIEIGKSVTDEVG
jgi:hypothetical protein